MDCAVCDDGLEAFDVRTNLLIEQFGQAVIGVAADPMFAYTVGLSRASLPEIICIGINPGISTEIINTLAALMRERGVPEPMTRIPDLVQGGIDTMLIDVPVEASIDEYLCAAPRFSPRIDRVMQMVWPDTKNVFPFEPGFEERFRPMQPLLNRLAN